LRLGSRVNIPAVALACGCLRLLGREDVHVLAEQSRFEVCLARVSILFASARLAFVDSLFVVLLGDTLRCIDGQSYVRTPSRCSDHLGGTHMRCVLGVLNWQALTLAVDAHVLRSVRGLAVCNGDGAGVRLA